jgi:hypothetical protein
LINEIIIHHNYESIYEHLVVVLRSYFLSEKKLSVSVEFLLRINLSRRFINDAHEENFYGIIKLIRCKSAMEKIVLAFFLLF